MKRKNKLEILGTQYAKDENTALSNYSMGKSIGEGTFGKVHLGVHNLTNEKVAIKVLEKAKISESDEIERINREIKFLKKFKNINIIKIYEIIETNSKVYFIMEYASGGELYNYIVKKKKLEEKEASFFFAQIVYALEFIHKQNITHRDIKPENMLLTENKTIKLIDFGLSNQYNKGGLLKTPCGSPCYAAPEMILGRRYNGMHIDIWSLGIALFAMICGHLPFEDENNDKLYKKILDCKLQFKSHVSDIARDIISKILSVNPNKRIGFEEIKSHAFFKLSNEMINKKNLGLYLNKVDNSILDKMVELGFEKNNIISNVESNNHNNITTTYELLLNKYKGIGDVSLNINNKISNNNVINNSKNHLINQNKDSKLCNKDSNNNNNITTLNKQKLNSNLCNINNTTTNNNNNNILTKSNAIDIKTKQDSNNKNDQAINKTIKKKITKDRLSVNKKVDLLELDDNKKFDNDDYKNFIKLNIIDNDKKRQSISDTKSTYLEKFEKDRREYILQSTKTGIDPYIIDSLTINKNDFTNKVNNKRAISSSATKNLTHRIANISTSKKGDKNNTGIINIRSNSINKNINNNAIKTGNSKTLLKSFKNNSQGYKKIYTVDHKLKGFYNTLTEDKEKKKPINKETILFFSNNIKNTDLEAEEINSNVDKSNVYSKEIKSNHNKIIELIKNYSLLQNYKIISYSDKKLEVRKDSVKLNIEIFTKNVREPKRIIFTLISGNHISASKFALRIINDIDILENK